ncbi:MAG: hypothetical protein ACPGXL_02360 [Chitinophagales bacterium]
MLKHTILTIFCFFFVWLMPHQANAQCDTPIISAYALAASCTNGIPNDDGYLQISAATDATHYNYIMGSDYSTGDVDIANAVAFDSTNDLPLQFSTLDNPSGSQDYTIRIFNGTSDCYTDTTLVLMEQDCETSCSCDEYIYVNEINEQAVHKFKVDGNGDLTEVIPEGPWYPNTEVSQLPRPHGIATDLNGFLYIAETDHNTATDGSIRRLTCAGDIIPETTFNIPESATNLVSVDNHLFVRSTQTYKIEVYDLCTGSALGTMCLENFGTTSLSSLAWGLSVGYDGTMTAFNYAYIFNWTVDDFINGNCIQPIPFDVSHVMTSVYGITRDLDGSYYYVTFDTFGDAAKLVKLDAAANFVTETAIDSIEGDGGWFGAISVVYVETCNCLYTSNFTLTDDCISRFDLDLNDIGPAVGPVGGVPSNNTDALAGKAIGRTKECCPSPNRQTINQTYCVSGSNEQLFLNDLFPCDGIVCEGQWMPADADAIGVYNDCDQSISAGIVPGCYRFTKGSDGLENHPKCGAFELNFNLEIIARPTITMSTNATICEGDSTQLSITTTATDIQWQMNTNSCQSNWANIDGATSATYTTTALSDTTYYRVVVNETGDCSTGSCPFESDCITISTEECCAPKQCLPVSIDKDAEE